MKSKTSLIISVFFVVLISCTIFVVNIPAEQKPTTKEHRPSNTVLADYPVSIPIIDVQFTPDKQIPLSNRL